MRRRTMCHPYTGLGPKSEREAWPPRVAVTCVWTGQDTKRIEEARESNGWFVIGSGVEHAGRYFPTVHGYL
jgi:hypothetical protein